MTRLSSPEGDDSASPRGDGVPLDRSIGLEQEFFLVEESGEPSVRADEFLERCRERSEREGDGKAACLAPEWVKGVVEVNTPPVRSLADLEREYADNVRLADPLGAGDRAQALPAGHLPAAAEARRQGGAGLPGPGPHRRTAERFMDAGRCAGTHLHLGLPDGTVDTESGVSPGRLRAHQATRPRGAPRSTRRRAADRSER